MGRFRFDILRFRSLFQDARIVAVAGASALSVTCILTVLPGQTAVAETYTVSSGGDESAVAVNEALDELKKAEAQYADARSSYVQAGLKTCALEKRASVLENMVPLQQAKSDEAARQLYKAQQHPNGLVEMLLSSSSLEDFIKQAEYLEHITTANISEIHKTYALLNGISAARSDASKLQDDATQALEDAEERRQAADDALQSAYKVRADRARDGIAEAKSQAGVGSSLVPSSAEYEAETARKSSESGASTGDSTSASSASTSGSSESASNSASSASSTSAKAEPPEVTGDTDPLDDGADWYTTEEEFVQEWAPRLNAFLQGSALAGQGENFAKSAWKYNIDPRWSAAISTIESSKGALCIRPHNAWGWGAADSDPYNLASEWDSWESAIDAHSRGLSRGYGYTLTIRGAHTYCPSNWETWYNTTLREMAKI